MPRCMACSKAKLTSGCPIATSAWGSSATLLLLLEGLPIAACCSPGSAVAVTCLLPHAIGARGTGGGLLRRWARCQSLALLGARRVNVDRLANGGRTAQHRQAQHNDDPAGKNTQSIAAPPSCTAADAKEAG